MRWEASLEARVSNSVVPSPFQPWHLEWTPPTFLSSYSHICLPLPFSQDTSAKWPLPASFGTFSGFSSPAHSSIFKVPNKMPSVFLKAH